MFLDDAKIYEQFDNDMEILDIKDLPKIEKFAASMNQKEILSYFLLSAEDLSEKELKVVDKVIQRGLARAINAASDKLFTNMTDSKMGAAACLSFLKRHAEGYKGDIDDNEGKEGSGFTYTININEEAEKGNQIQETKENEEPIKLKSV